jgi:glycine cleavage system H protein
VNYPSDCKYSKDHEWIRITDGICTIGITDHAQDQLGDVVFVELPEVGNKLEKNDVFGVVESVKAAVDCYMPLTGEIVEVNAQLETQAEIVNSDPHGDGWMVKIKLDDPEESNDLMDKTAYEAFLAELE